MLDISPVPVSTVHLCLYAAYLARFLLPQSVCVYISYVGLLHKDYGLQNPLADNWFLSSVLKGIKRTKGSPPVPRLPITVEILGRLRQCLDLSDSKHAAFWAICLVSFFGLFRKSHLLPLSSKDFSPTTFLVRSDFTFEPSTVTFGLDGARLCNWVNVLLLYHWLLCHLLFVQFQLSDSLSG